MKRVIKTVIALGFVLGLCVPAIAQTQQPPPKPAAQDEFVPIDQLAPKEELPAAPLVMAAYAVAWLVPFVYVLSVWRRLGKIEGEIAEVNRRLASGARR